MAEEELTDRPDGEGLPNEPDWALWDAEEQSRKIPAQHANRLYVKPIGDMLRMTFGEQVGDEIVYRTSFVVPIVTAYEMGDLLMRMANAGWDLQSKAWRQWVADHPEDAKPNG